MAEHSFLVPMRYSLLFSSHWQLNVGEFVESVKTCRRGVERVPTRTAIFAKTAKIANIIKSAKNRKIGRVSEKQSKRRLGGPRRELRFLQKLQKLRIL